jgi:cytochrome oxidase Cu insertion factor (SCO1/SenC/PrrC family)
MKPSPLLWILTLVLASIPPHVRAAASVETIWKRVQFAMSYMEPEKFQRLTPAEYGERARSGISKFEAAMKDFLAAAPNDPRVWEAKVFDAARLSYMREAGGFPAPAEGEPMKVVEEALQAPDATPVAKARASRYKITQLALDAREGKFAPDEWMRMADAHLKDYPGNDKENDAIKMWQGKIRTIIDLMALPPIDLKLTSMDGAEVDLAKLRGKVVLLYFWTISKDDGMARGMTRIVQDTYLKHHADGFEVIGIPIGADKSKVVSYLKQSGTAWPQIHDPHGLQSKIAMQYKVTGTSTLHLFDKKGILVRAYVRTTLPEEVEKLLTE